MSTLDEARAAAARMVNREALRLTGLNLGIAEHRVHQRLANLSSSAENNLFFEIKHSGFSIDADAIIEAEKGWARNSVVKKQANPLADIYTKHLRR